MRFRPAWFLSNTYCWINCSPEWDILTFHSLSSRCRYRRMTCDIPHLLQRRPPHCCRNHWKDSSTSSQTWPRPRALRTVSNRPIFSPSSSSSTSFDLSSAHTNTCSLSLFFFFSPAPISHCCQVCLLVVLVSIKWTVTGAGVKRLFFHAGSKAVNKTGSLTKKTSRADAK